MDAPWSILFRLNMVLLVVLLFAIPFVEPGTGAYVALWLAAAVIGLSLIGLFAVGRLGWNPYQQE